MEIHQNNSVNIKDLEELFTKCFSKLKDDDGKYFKEEEDQDLREWFGIDNLDDYLKYSHVITAEENGKLVGGAIVGMSNPLTFPDGKKYELFILGVLPEYRNRGIGKLLMDEVLHISAENGAKCLILNTHELMESTQKYYEDLDFEKIGILKKYYDNGSAVFF